jgi:hypothetical protein
MYINFKSICLLPLVIVALLGMIGPKISLAQTAGVGQSTGMMNNLKGVAVSSGYDEGTGKDTLINNVANIIKVLLGLLGFIFVILTIYAGVLWMTAAGNETQVKNAQNIIKRAVTGLIIVVMAYAITYFIFANLPGGGGAGPA